MTPEQRTALEAVAGRALTQAEVEQIDPLLEPDNRNDEAIASALSKNADGTPRMRVVAGPVITTRGAAAKFPQIGPLPGALAFEAALQALEIFATQAAQSPDAAMKLQARAVSRQLVSFDERGLDFGDPVLRGMLDGFVPAVLTQAQADGFKSLALAADPVSPAAVSAALNALGA